MAALTDVVGARGALLVSAVVALGIMAALWFISRGDRRDRHQVLGVAPRLVLAGGMGAPS